MSSNIDGRISKRVFVISALMILAVVCGWKILSVSKAKAAQTLTVTKAGVGAIRGKVTSDITGIDCGTTCSADFNDGDMVTLTPTVETGTLAVFVGWSGACTGTGTCTVTMDAAKSVTAMFSETNALQKCVAENPNLWGLRFNLGVATITAGQCRAICTQGGGNGYFLVSKSTGMCLCGTSAKPQSTNAATTGCDQSCPAPYQCGGAGSRYSAYSIGAPTAASASISGQVFTPDGRGLRNAQVSLTDLQGNTRTVLTSPFGYYTFDDVTVGETYVIAVRSKQYQFTPQFISVNADLTNTNFYAIANPE